MCSGEIPRAILTSESPLPFGKRAVGKQTTGEAELRSVRAGRDGRVVLEAEPAIDGRGLGSVEVRQKNHILEIVREATHRVREPAIVGIAFDRIADFQDAARGLVAVDRKST